MDSSACRKSGDDQCDRGWSDGRVISGRMDSAEILSSDDGGQTWTSRTLEGNAIEDLTVDPQDRRVVYAVVNGGGVYRSEDGGLSWHRTPQDLQEISPTFATAGDDGEVYVSGESVPLRSSGSRGNLDTTGRNAPYLGNPTRLVQLRFACRYDGRALALVACDWLAATTACEYRRSFRIGCA